MNTNVGKSIVLTNNFPFHSDDLAMSAHEFIILCLFCKYACIFKVSENIVAISYFCSSYQIRYDSKKQKLFRGKHLTERKAVQ